MSEDSAPFRNFYSRTRGKTLRPAQQAYLAEDLETHRLKGVTSAENPARATLDDLAAIWLEIGFGAGEHLLHLAATHPGQRLIGCEPYTNGIAQFLGRLRQQGSENIRVHPGDVRDLFDVLKDAVVQRTYLNYPDPWPKARHHRRRFVTPQYLTPLARVMAKGAELRMASDIPDYIRQTREEVPAAGFRLIYDSDTPWDGWIRTRYEAKAIREGRSGHYLIWERL